MFYSRGSLTGILRSCEKQLLFPLRELWDEGRKGSSKSDKQLLFQMITLVNHQNGSLEMQKVSSSSRGVPTFKRIGSNIRQVRECQEALNGIRMKCCVNWWLLEKIAFYSVDLLHSITDLLSGLNKKLSKLHLLKNQSCQISTWQLPSKTFADRNCKKVLQFLVWSNGMIRSNKK